MTIKNVVVNSLMLTGLLVSIFTYASSDKSSLRSLFDINQSFCAIKTNGVLGMDNRNSALAGRGYGTSSTNSMLFLENGINNISLEIASLDWFTAKSDSPKGKFDPNASCQLSLIASGNGKTITLNTIYVAINEENEPYEKGTSNKSGSINISKVEKIKAVQIEEGHFMEDYFNKYDFPKDMDVYRFTKTLSISGLPKWKWTDATPFTGSREQILALQNAYSELWRAFASKNNNAIKSQIDESLNAWSISTNTDKANIYNDLDFVTDLENSTFKMLPIDWFDYKVEVMNKGRLVRFVNKSAPTFSPVSYLVEDDENDELIGTYSPIFSLIDGKFIPVI